MGREGLMSGQDATRGDGAAQKTLKSNGSVYSNVLFLGTLKKASAARASSGYGTGYWLGPPLIINSSSVLLPFFPASPCSARLRPAAAGSRRVGGRSGSQPSLHLPSTCARAPFAARLDARALRWSCARTPKSGQLVPVQRPNDGAECARVLCRCGGEAAV